MRAHAPLSISLAPMNTDLEKRRRFGYRRVGIMLERKGMDGVPRRGVGAPTLGEVGIRRPRRAV